ncbi:MAG: MFS transporter, partial [Roseovarius gahaiensis]
LIGRIVDRFGITFALISAALLIAVSTGLAALSPSVLVLSLLQLVIGFGTSASFGPLIADISLWFLKRRGIAVAITASGNYLSGAIWPVILAGVLAEQGWRAVYLVLAIVTVAMMIPLALLLRRRVPLAARTHADQVSGLRAQAAGFSPRSLMLMLGVAGIGCCVAMSMPQVHIVSLCVDLGYGPAVGGQMLSLMLLGGVASRLVSGLIADRLGGVMTLLIGSGLQCLALFLYLPAGGLVSLYVVSMIFGLAQGGIVPSYALVVREYMPSHEAGRRVGFVLMMTILGMALGGWMSGWIYDMTGSYQMAFINGIVWNGVNIAIMVLILMRTRPRRGMAAAA